MLRWGEASATPAALAAAQSAFRPDLYRRALAGQGVEMPSADSKVEGLAPGAGTGPTPALVNAFFDGGSFDSSELAAAVTNELPPER